MIVNFSPFIFSAVYTQFTLDRYTRLTEKAKGWISLMKMNRKRGAAVLCLTSMLLLSACGGEETPEAVMDASVSVTSTAAQVGTLSTDGTYVGSISSEEGTASVMALVSGNVEEVSVKVGDTVQHGQLLCRFDDESAQLALQNARASYQSVLAGIESAQLNYESALAGQGGSEDGELKLLQEQVKTAEKNYSDTQALFEIGAASQLEVDTARQTLMAAQAGLESAEIAMDATRAAVRQAETGLLQAQAGLDSAEYQASLYRLTAPISGTVEAVNVVKNNFTPSGTAAFVITGVNNKTVTFYVPNEVRASIQIGQNVNVTNVGRSYQGTVSEVGGIVTADGLFRVKAILNDAADLPDGVSVELTTAAYLEEDAVLVPTDALYFDTGDEAYVYIIQDGKAVRRDVTIGLYNAETAAITEGLEGGEEVIVTWSAGLKDGAPIRTGDASAAPENDTAPGEGSESSQMP